MHPVDVRPHVRPVGAVALARPQRPPRVFRLPDVAQHVEHLTGGDENGAHAPLPVVRHDGEDTHVRLDGAAAQELERQHDDADQVERVVVHGELDQDDGRVFVDPAASAQVVQRLQRFVVRDSHIEHVAATAVYLPVEDHQHSSQSYT